MAQAVFPSGTAGLVFPLPSPVGSRRAHGFPTVLGQLTQQTGVFSLPLQCPLFPWAIVPHKLGFSPVRELPIAPSYHRVYRFPRCPVLLLFSQLSRSSHSVSPGWVRPPEKGVSPNATLCRPRQPRLRSELLRGETGTSTTSGCSCVWCFGVAT